MRRLLVCLLLILWQMCLFCGCGGSHAETKSPRGIIKPESRHSEAWGGAALGRTRHLTLQFLVEDSRRAVMMEPAQGSISGWTDGWMEEEKVSNMEQLIVLLAASWLFCLWTVYHFWQEVTGRPDHRRRARMDENLVLTDTTSLARSHTSLGPHGYRVCAIVGLISALSIL